MALIYMDGFDHYGSTVSNMMDGLWAEVGSGGALSTAQVRTGTRALQIGGGDARLVLPESRTVVGVGMGVFFTSLPTNNTAFGYEFRDNANQPHISLNWMSTGGIAVRRGNPSGGTILEETEPVITAGAWHHVEIRIKIDDTDGEIEVRVNGVTVLDLAEIDTSNTANVHCAQISFNSGASFQYFIDDLFVWDDTGNSNNDFIGDRRVITLFPEEDTAQADWAANTGLPVDAINEAAPNDETTYIEATAPAQVSEFTLDDLPSDVSLISAVMTLVRMRKTDAGGCNVQTSLVSDDIGSPPAPAESNGVDRPITEQWTYWFDVHELDPATGAAWTRGAVNDALIKFERTA